MAVEKVVIDGDESIEAVLRGGQSLKLRPIRPDDKRRLEEFFYRLTPMTRYFRFQYAKETITESELKHFTEVVPPRRFAYVATMGEGDREKIIAVGRWDMLLDNRGAEVAFTVDDNIQLRGVGTLLLEELVRAAEGCGITRFEARVLAENTRMIEVFEESGFRITRRSEGGVYDITIDLKDQEEYSRRQAWREHTARSAGVRRLLCPRRVAVIGASRDPESVGGALFRNLLKDGFSGIVFPVNPSSDSIAGVLAYPSVLDVPGDVDLAVVVVPADRVLKVVDECAQKGVPGLVIISAGFGESGKEGAELEKRLLDKVVSYGMRVIGPNCLGALNNDPDVRLNATFSPATPPSGNLSIGSQSGALGLALLDHARSINLGISAFVSIGNRIDVSSNDLLEYWEDDVNTAVIALYLESFGGSRKFGRIARRISYKKPIIAVKAGRSQAGAKAAASHTGALAASDVAADALFRQAGVVRVNTIAEMFNAAEVFTQQPLPRGPRVGILTNAGGPGVLAADACEGYGLKVLPLSEETQRRLKEFLPKSAAVVNPVDMIATAPAASYVRALSILLEDPDLDSIIVIYIPPMVTRPEDIATALKEVLARQKADKPVIPCFMVTEDVMIGLRRDPKLSIRAFKFPEDAVQALANAYSYSTYKSMEEGGIVKFPDIDAERVRSDARVKEALKRAGWLMAEDAMGLLSAYGIPCVKTVAAFTEDEAAARAGEIGYPVAMKVRSSRILHKTDVSGLFLGLKDEAHARSAYRDLTQRFKARGIELEGVTIQPMAAGGQEMIVGMSIDPVFGPLVMIGLGGIQVELTKDVAFSIHPLRDADPDRMFAQLKSFPILVGWRGRPLSDIKSLKEVLLRFSALIEDFPEIEQMEINPLVVMSEGRGCAAIDARIYVKAR